jgi:hypothetical protein
MTTAGDAYADGPARAAAAEGEKSRDTSSGAGGAAAACTQKESAHQPWKPGPRREAPP